MLVCASVESGDGMRGQPQHASSSGDLPIDMDLGLGAETDEPADGPLSPPQDRFDFGADSVDRAPGAARPHRSRITELGTAKTVSSETWLARWTSGDVKVARGHDWIELRDVFRRDPHRLGRPFITRYASDRR